MYLICHCYTLLLIHVYPIWRFPIIIPLLEYSRHVLQLTVYAMGHWGQLNGNQDWGAFRAYFSPFLSDWNTSEQQSHHSGQLTRDSREIGALSESKNSLCVLPLIRVPQIPGSQKESEPVLVLKPFQALTYCITFLLDLYQSLCSSKKCAILWPVPATVIRKVFHVGRY